MKEQPPVLDSSDMPDVKTLTPEELAKVPFDKWRLYCGIRGCNCYTNVRDYGIWPELWGKFTTGPWLNVETNRLLCHKHWRNYRFSESDMIPWKRFYHIDTVKNRIMEEIEQ